MAAIFLSGSTIDFQAHRGIMDGMESFGRISLFPGFLPLASSKFFGFGLQYVSRFRKRYLHYSLTDPGQQVFIRWSDFVGFSRINGLRFSDFGALRVFPGFLDCTTVFQVFG